MMSIIANTSNTSAARVEASYRASVDLLTTAWKENPEFGIAIDLVACSFAFGVPLASFAYCQGWTTAGPSH
jgi:hypothetical protein